MNDKGKRWGGYVCPDCRFVFRVPRDHDGTGLVCPSCRRMLKIPRSGDVPPPLLAEIRRLAQPPGPTPTDATETGEVADPTPEGKRERLAEKLKVSKRRSAESHGRGPHQSSWEHGTSGMQRFRRLDSVRMGWMLGAGTVLFGLIVVGVVLVLNSSPAGDTVVAGIKTPDLKSLPMAGPKDGGPPAAGKRNDAAILVESESLARDFLNAQSIAELLPVVRHPERTKARLERYYPGGRVDGPGMAEFNPGKNVLHIGSEVEVGVRTKSFELRTLNLVETAAGLRVDWESWVGWSDMGWPEFFDTLPTTAQAFRVVVKKVDYYNFNFTDDSKWRSFRLESRTGDATLYGYVERGSELENRIQIAPELKKALLILKLRFPAGAVAESNQVLIDEVVHDSWVEPE